MAKLTRKLWVGIGAATIVGASFAGATAGQAQHKGHDPRLPPPAKAPPTTPRRAARPISRMAARATPASASIATSR